MAISSPPPPNRHTYIPPPPLPLPLPPPQNNKNSVSTKHERTDQTESILSVLSAVKQLLISITLLRIYYLFIHWQFHLAVREYMDKCSYSCTGSSQTFLFSKKKKKKEKKKKERKTTREDDLPKTTFSAIRSPPPDCR